MPWACNSKLTKIKLPTRQVSTQWLSTVIRWTHVSNSMYNMYILLALALYTNKHPIMSGVGPFGSWQNIHYCPQGTVGVGFYLDTEKPSSGDQIGATDFTLLCGDPFGSRNPSSYLSKTIFEAIASIHYRI